MAQAFVAADTDLPVRNWTVGDLLGHAAQAAGASIAIRQDGLEWSYAALRRDSRRLARFLLTLFDKGDHVAIWGANSAPWALFQLAAAQAGLVLVTLNPALRGAEVEALLLQSKAVGLIMDSQHRGTDLDAIVAAHRGALPLLRSILGIAQWADYLASVPDDDGPLHVAVAPDDVAMILYTSGTTGTPKGVMLHHRGIVNNALLGSERYEIGDGLAWLGVLPFFHVGGSVTSTLGCIARLGTNIVVPAFEAGSSNRPSVKPAKSFVRSFITVAKRMPGTGSSTRSMQVDRRRMGSVGKIFLCS